MTIRTMTAMTAHLNFQRQDVHDRLAGAYLTLTRPLTEVKRTEVLSQIDGCMADLRNMDSQLTQLTIAIARFDNDLVALGNSIHELRYEGDTMPEMKDEASAPVTD